MADVMTMPAVLADSTEAELQSWLVSVGDAVTKGQAIAEIETEKATVELESDFEGTIAKFTAEAGTSVEVGAPVVVIAASGDTDEDVARALAASGAATGAAETSAPEASAAEVKPSEADTSSSAAPAASAEPGAGSVAAGSTAGGRIFASPLARKIAGRRGLDLHGIEGSGPNGRIIRSDVDRAAEAGTAAATSMASAPASAAGTTASANDEAAPTMATAGTTSANEAQGYVDEPVTGMRKTIAARLSESKSTVPHFYLSMDVYVDDLLRLRRSLNEQLEGTGTKISVNDLILKSLGNALAAVPEANATWNGDSIRRFESVDVGVAIAIDNGLVTPVVTNVAGRTITATSSAVSDLRSRAEGKKLRQNELEGGTFALTNLGMYAVREFSAIINPPHAGILAVGAAEQRAVVIDGELSAATVMTCTLSADHRVLDGAVAARLLSEVKAQLENPIRILM